MQDVTETLRSKYESIGNLLNERAARAWMAAEARAIGRGGIEAVVRATGASRNTVVKGMRELDGLEETPPPDRVRRHGAGRPAADVVQPGLLGVLRELLEEATRGDPESPLLWTSKSLRTLETELELRGFRASPHVVSRLVRESLGYTLQAPAKTREGKRDHPDRDAQFRHIDKSVRRAQKLGQPVISVDTKKKELIGDYKNGGREWRPKGKPVEVLTHDFPDPKVPKAIPYGVYDVTNNEGWVSVGNDHDTPEFATAAIEQWWRLMGRKRFPSADELLVTADCGGSNSARARGWKYELQQLSNRTGLVIHVRHFPPGTSKWNKIEHRMFSAITTNWRGTPLRSYETVVNLIAATTTTKGLRVRAKLDPRKYPIGVEYTPDQIKEIKITKDTFHGEWNYTIRPATI